LNIELTVVENGRKAVESFQSSPPEAIITDISMPEMDGMEATKNIRELEGRGPSIPIYALTAHAMLGDKERFMEAGMNGYLTKPLKKADIVQTIEDLIAIRDLAAESAA
jgi:CheY-like chemotaxis protein